MYSGGRDSGGVVDVATCGVSGCQTCGRFRDRPLASCTTRVGWWDSPSFRKVYKRDRDQPGCVVLEQATRRTSKSDVDCTQRDGA